MEIKSIDCFAGKIALWHYWEMVDRDGMPLSLKKHMTLHCLYLWKNTWHCIVISVIVRIHCLVRPCEIMT